MKKLYLTALSLGAIVNFSAQEIIWEKSIKSGTQDFLSQVTTTIDGQYLITGSSIQSKKLSAENKQNMGYDFHLVKLNQNGDRYLKNISLETAMTTFLLMYLHRKAEIY